MLDSVPLPSGLASPVRATTVVSSGGLAWASTAGRTIAVKTVAAVSVRARLLNIVGFSRGKALETPRYHAGSGVRCLSGRYSTPPLSMALGSQFVIESGFMRLDGRMSGLGILG